MTKPSCLLLIATLTMIRTSSAAAGKFDGEFTDKNFLNGQAVFEFSIQQSGNALNIAFHAAYSDGHGATPDATGAGKITGNTAQLPGRTARAIPAPAQSVSSPIMLLCR